jgi:hypothetical protein
LIADGVEAAAEPADEGAEPRSFADRLQGAYKDHRETLAMLSDDLSATMRDDVTPREGLEDPPSGVAHKP